MFIGHYAVGFAAKRAAPKTSLGWLLGSTVLLDLVWPVFFLLGWEEVRVARGSTPFLNLDFLSYPISHSLATTIGWSVLAGGAYWAATRYRAGAAWIGIGVASHWVLDFVAHRPDLHAPASVAAGGRADRKGEKVTAGRTELIARAVVLRSEASCHSEERSDEEPLESRDPSQSSAGRGRLSTGIAAIESMDRPEPAVGDIDGEPRCISNPKRPERSPWLSQLSRRALDSFVTSDQFLRFSRLSEARAARTR
jgi:hypothetical protein